MKFSNDNKEVKEFNSNYFDYGVHKVLVSDVTLGGTGEGEKEFIEVEVVDPGDLEVKDSARVWFTSDKAINYSFNVLRQIFVHCAPEEKKDEARAMFDKIGDTDTLTQIMEKCKGRQIWFTKYPNPDRTYTNQAGETKASIDKNVMGYEPKVKTELLAEPKLPGGQITKDNINEVFPGAKEVPFKSQSDAASSTVPKSDAWS